MNRILLTLIASALLAQFGLTQSKSIQVRVDGEGYLRFVRDGRVVYSKASKLVVVEGRLADASGAKLAPAIAVSSLEGVTIDLEGNVSKSHEVIGRIVLAMFTSDPGSKDDRGFLVSANRPKLGDPGDGANGVIRTGGGGTSPTTVADSSPETEQAPREAVPSKTTISTKSVASLAIDKPRTIPKSGIQITFPDRIEVAVTAFTLGNIATIDAPQSTASLLGAIELGDTPPLGVDRIVDRAKILAKVRSAGIDPNTVSLIGPDKVRVTRKGQTIVHTQFVEAAIRGAQLKGYSVGLESSAPGPDLTAPIGELQLVCEALSGSNGDLTATIGVYVDGRRFNSRSVKLKTTGTSSNIKAGAIIKVRVVSHNVRIESTAKVVRVDQTTGMVTVQVVDTGAQLVGKLLPDGTLEVQA